MTGDARRLRPEERESIDSKGKDGLVASARHGRERHVIDWVPPPVRPSSACMDVAAGAYTDANEAVRRKALLLERPENRVAGIGRGFRNLRPAGLVQGSARRNDQVYRSQVPTMEVDDGLSRSLEHGVTDVDDDADSAGHCGVDPRQSRGTSDVDCLFGIELRN